MTSSAAPARFDPRGLAGEWVIVPMRIASSQVHSDGVPFEKVRQREGFALDVIAQLETILPALDRVGAQVRTEQFDNRTPCASFRVRDLFDHMIGGASQFAPQLRGRPPETGRDAATLRDDERAAALSDALAELLAAAKSPGALGRAVDLPFGRVPGQVLARFLTVDGMVHTWDIAQATGQPYEPPSELVRQVLATARELIAPEMRDGETFAAEVRVDDDVPPIVQLAAFTGRTT